MKIEYVLIKMTGDKHYPQNIISSVVGSFVSGGSWKI